MNEELKSEYKNPSVNASKVIPVTSHTGQETGTLQVTHQEFCLTSLKIYCHPFIFLLRECTCRSKVAFARTHTDSYSRFMHVLMAIHWHFSFLSNESMAWTISWWSHTFLLHSKRSLVILLNHDTSMTPTGGRVLK